MADHKGDPAKQTADCTVNKDGRCPNLKETGGGFEGERYRCEVCGESYFLDYEEMK
jgi:hypothetical protein